MHDGDYMREVSKERLTRLLASIACCVMFGNTLLLLIKVSYLGGPRCNHNCYSFIYARARSQIWMRCVQSYMATCVGMGVATAEWLLEIKYVPRDSSRCPI